MQCECRRHAETNLRCARCDTPICPDCSRVGAVGMLCRKCGSHRHSPIYKVSAQGLVLGTLGSLAIAIVGGWLLASIGMHLGLFGGFLALVYGIGVAEVALRITGRKRGLHMEIMAGASAALGIVIGLAIHMLTLPPLPPMPHKANPAAIYFLNPFLNPMTYLIIAVAIYGAVSRIRNI